MFDGKAINTMDDEKILETDELVVISNSALDTAKTITITRVTYWYLAITFRKMFPNIGKFRRVTQLFLQRVKVMVMFLLTTHFIIRANKKAKL